MNLQMKSLQVVTHLKTHVILRAQRPKFRMTNLPLRSKFESHNKTPESCFFFWMMRSSKAFKHLRYNVGLRLTTPHYMVYGVQSSISFHWLIYESMRSLLEAALNQLRVDMQELPLKQRLHFQNSSSMAFFSYRRINRIASSVLWRIHTAVDLYSILHLRDGAGEITQAHIPFLKVPGGKEGVDEMWYIFWWQKVL